MPPFDPVCRLGDIFLGGQGIADVIGIADDTTAIAPSQSPIIKTNIKIISTVRKNLTAQSFYDIIIKYDFVRPGGEFFAFGQDDLGVWDRKPK